MAPPHGRYSDDGYNRDAEDDMERLDRHWIELLQELRVMQTGVQILTGFLLMLPFQQNFAGLEGQGLWLYVASVTLALVSTGLLIAPVSIHRLLFGRHRRAALITATDALVRSGLICLALCIAVVAGLIFTVVFGDGPGRVTLGIATTGFIVLWWVLPEVLRGRAG
ncbi:MULTISPECIES: DUF6328 family protein [unclassified Janibacter]|uniref:DUF6328 family protein n=1 Tax=unclassified Janibacter TaxID=2649294 RepID=UPI003D0940E3